MRPARGFHARGAGDITGLRRISSSRSMTSPDRSGASRDDFPSPRRAERAASEVFRRASSHSGHRAASAAGSIGVRLAHRHQSGSTGDPQRPPAPLDVPGEEGGEPKTRRQNVAEGTEQDPSRGRAIPQHPMHAVVHRHLGGPDPAGDRPRLGIPRGRGDHQQRESHGLVNSSAKYPAPAIEKRIRFHRACRERNWRRVRYTFTLSTGDPEITTFFPAFRNISPRT